MSDDWKRYVRPCNADGVEHDCMYEFIQGWDVESFTVWLAAERARIWDEAYGLGFDRGAGRREGIPPMNQYRGDAA
jgi:hypothetical protein